jgi:hypothetical protein
MPCGHCHRDFSPEDKVRFLFWLFSAQRLERALNLFSGRSEK